MNPEKRNIGGDQEQIPDEYKELLRGYEDKHGTQSREDRQSLLETWRGAHAEKQDDKILEAEEKIQEEIRAESSES